jgi:hypothetical protein
MTTTLKENEFVKNKTDSQEEHTFSFPGTDSECAITAPRECKEEVCSSK